MMSIAARERYRIKTRRVAKKQNRQLT